MSAPGLRFSPGRTLEHGVFVVLVVAVLAVAVPWLRMALPLAVLAVAALAAADGWLLYREPPPSLQRPLPPKAPRGRPLPVTLYVHNRAARAIRLDLREALPADWIAPEPVWLGLEVAAGETKALAMELVPRLRGLRRAGRAVALVGSPLGAWRRRVELAASEPVLIHPETERFLRPEALDPKRVLASLGVRPKRRRGEGLEFESLREYVVGDEPRRIDWRATARRGRPMVRTHRHEESHTVLLAVDASRLMGARAPRADAADARFPTSKLDHAVDAALALGFASLVAGDRVGLFVFDREVRARLAPVADRASLGRIVETLAPVQPRPVEADYRRLGRSLMAHQRKRALIVVLTDFIEADAEELLHPMALLAARHEVLFVALREPILETLDAEGPPGPRESGAAADGEALETLHRRIVLADLWREREARLVSLRRRGLSVLDVRPEDATASTLNRYLEVRERVG